MKCLRGSRRRGAAGSLGVLEALHGADVSDQEEWSSLLQDDLAGIGHTLLQVACAPLHTISLEACGSLFSAELTGILAALTNRSHGVASAGQVCALSLAAQSLLA